MSSRIPKTDREPPTAPLDHQTDKRREWLERLEAGPARRGHAGIAEGNCMMLGWTEWAPRPGGTGPLLEQLTEAGRAKLAAWREADD